VPPPIFLLPKFPPPQCVEEAQITIEMFSKRLIWWRKKGKNEKLTFYGTQNRGIFPNMLGRFCPILLVKLRLLSYPSLLDRDLKLFDSLRNFMPHRTSQNFNKVLYYRQNEVEHTFIFTIQYLIHLIAYVPISKYFLLCNAPITIFGLHRPFSGRSFTKEFIYNKGCPRCAYVYDVQRYKLKFCQNCIKCKLFTGILRFLIILFLSPDKYVITVIFIVRK